MPRCYTCHPVYQPVSRPVSRYRVFRQLFLGRSQDGQLTILSSPISASVNRQNDVPSNTAFISNLSDELLHEIFSYLRPNQDDDWSWAPVFYETALPLLTVSKRFYRIMLPRMYKAIQLQQHSLARPCLAVKQFHRSIKENPGLGSMVRIVRVHLEWNRPDTASDADYIIANEILSLLPNVELFHLQGGYVNPPTWSMIRTAIANWPRIKYVSLSREDFSLYMPPVCELVVATPSLRTLNLHGVYAPDQRSSTSTSRLIWTPPSKVCTVYFEFCVIYDMLNLNQDIERTSNITTITIHDFGEQPEALQNLLKLPRTLDHFTFGKIHSSCAHWSLDMFQSLLSLHQQTLKSIEIGQVGRGTTPINFLDFPRLETLNLSHWVYRESPEVAAATLLAPRLQTFIWDFRIIDQHTESWTDFGEVQKEWIIKFAELADAKKSALQKIQIVFCPDDFYGPTTREELTACMSTPWDLMDQAKQQIKPFGIELAWNEHWTREKCLQIIEGHEKFEEESVQQDEASYLGQDVNEWSDLEESLT